MSEGNPLQKIITIIDIKILCIAFLFCSCSGTGQEQSAAESYSGPVIDLHAHVFFDEDVAKSVNPERPATPDGFSQDVADSRLEKAAAVVMAHQQGIQETRARNDQLWEFVDQGDNSLLAAGSVHPADGEQAVKELERMAERGFSMLKLHPNTQEFSVESAAVRNIACKAGDLDLPVLFDFSGALRSNDIGEYITLAMQCPQTQFVLAHAGNAKFHETLVLAVLAKYPWYQHNIWLDISVIANMYVDSPYTEQFVWVLRQVGMERILFGSDYPFYTPSEAIAAVEQLGLTDEEMHQIFFKNAKELLGLTVEND